MESPFAGLKCLCCGEVDVVSIDLDDLKTFRCRECSDEFDKDAVAEQVEKWAKVMEWIDKASAA